MKKYISKFVFLLFLTASYSQELPAFFSDSMVLQRKDSVPVWGTDIPNQRIEIIASWGEKAETVSDKEGNWSLLLKTSEAGGPYTILFKGSRQRILKDVLLGEVWFASGQSNMEMPLRGFTNNPVNSSNRTILASSNQNIRFFKTKRNASLSPQLSVEGDWKISTPANSPEFSAVAYHFADLVNEHLDIPIGIITSTWGGSKVQAWLEEKSVKKFQELKIPNVLSEEVKKKRQTATALYNGMVHPYLNFKIKGILWYQGESDRSTENYDILFAELIESWRKKWDSPKLPFYFVQIAPFDYGGYSQVPGNNAAFVREAQLKTYLTVPNTGIVVTTDIGDCSNVHPAEKETIGSRLAYWALGEVYGVKGISYKTPVFSNYVINEHKITLEFDEVKYGFIPFENIEGFEIGDSEGNFYPATAVLNPDKTITVSSDKVEDPKNLRYNFSDCPTSSLKNSAGIPVSPFRI